MKSPGRRSGELVRANVHIVYKKHVCPVSVFGDLHVLRIAEAAIKSCIEFAIFSLRFCSQGLRVLLVRT